jgi:ABC-type branched-subunit amino acid transport system substrate-binding protein
VRSFLKRSNILDSTSHTQGVGVNGLFRPPARQASSQAQILIGQTAGFTGPVGAGVKETTDGAKLYIDAVNAKGGVNGQKIELISLDDKFEPKLPLENARKLIEEQNVLALFLTRGTPHTEAIIPLLDKNGVALVGPSTGAMVLHQPVKTTCSTCAPPTSAKPKKP